MRRDLVTEAARTTKSQEGGVAQEYVVQCGGGSGRKREGCLREEEGGKREKDAEMQGGGPKTDQDLTRVK